MKCPFITRITLEIDDTTNIEYHMSLTHSVYTMTIQTLHITTDNIHE